MGFRLVPKSVTLNDLERRNGRVVCVISPNSVVFRSPIYRVQSIRRKKRLCVLVRRLTLQVMDSLNNV